MDWSSTVYLDVLNASSDNIRTTCQSTRHGQAAAHAQHLAGDEVRVEGSEECDRACQVGWLPEPAKRDAARHRVENLLASGHRSLQERSVSWSRTDDVDVDATCGEFAREGFGKTDDGGLASRVNRFAA